MRIIKNRDVVFMEDNRSIRNNLRMCPNGRNEGPTLVVVDESSKSPLFYGGGKFTDYNEQVRGNEIVIEES